MIIILWPLTSVHVGIDQVVVIFRTLKSHVAAIDSGIAAVLWLAQYVAFVVLVLLVSLVRLVLPVLLVIRIKLVLAVVIGLPVLPILCLVLVYS